MTFKIAFRNILRHRRRTLFTVLTMVGGFTLAAVSLGLVEGSYNYIINIFTRTSLGHIQVHKGDYLDKPTIYKTIEDYEEVGEKIMSVDGVEAWTPRLKAAGLVSVGDKTAGAQIIGINPEQENASTNFGKKVKQGKLFSGIPSHGAIVGKGLAKILKAELEDEVVVVSQGADGSIANDLYKIVGIYQSGDDFSDRSSMYLHLKDAQELFVLEGRVHELVIIVSDIKKVNKLQGEIEKALNDPELEVLPWQKVSATFYNAMEADKKGNTITYFIIMLIVAIGVLNTVLMSVLERTREFGVLKALGTRPLGIFRLILIEVTMMAITAIVVASIISLILNYILSIHGINMGITYDIGGVVMEEMYAEVNAMSIYLPAIIVFFAALFVSIFPAIKAARTEPAKTMRFH